MRIAKSPSELGFNRYDEPRLAKALEHATDKRIFQRLQAVLLVAQGLTADEVAVIENVSAQAVYNWVYRYLDQHQVASPQERSTPEHCPSLHQFMAMDMDERWVNRSPKAMLETFHWFRGEGFSMIIEDILRLPKKPGVIAEGFRLAPHLVKPLLAVRSQAVWLLPPPEFRQAVFDSRGGPEWGFLGKTSDPERALRNLLERDAMFTHRLYEEARRLELNTIEVDTTMTVDDLARRVTESFGL